MPNQDPGADLVALLLADFANVREGMLNVVSAGITRMAFPGGLPASTSSYLALMVYIHPDAADKAHEATVALQYPEIAEQIARFEVKFGASAERHPGEGLYLPLAIPLSPVVFTKLGQVDVNVSLNGQSAGLLSFWIGEPPPAPAVLFPES